MFKITIIMLMLMKIKINKINYLINNLNIHYHQINNNNYHQINNIHYHLINNKFLKNNML